MFAVNTIRIAILLAIVLLFDKCSGYPSIRQKQGIAASYCTGCGEFCHTCEYGVVMSNACGIRQCAKGPDESCGGPGELYGTCGEGMHCSCYRCVGCSSEKLGCSVLQNPCLPHKSSESRDIVKFGRWPAVM